MKKAKDILGLSIILLETGEEILSIEGILFSQGKRKVQGFLIDEGGWFKGAKILLLKDVHNIGKDAVIIHNKEMIMSSTKVPEVEKILEEEYDPFDMEVIDDEGNKIGFVEDIIFDEKNGKIESLEVSGGVFEDIINGRLNIPLSQEMRLENQRVIISSECMEGLQKSGGLRKYFSEEEKKKGRPRK